MLHTILASWVACRTTTAQRGRRKSKNGAGMLAGWGSQAVARTGVASDAGKKFMKSGAGSAVRFAGTAHGFIDKCIGLCR